MYVYFCDYSNSPTATNIGWMENETEIAGEKVDWSFNLVKEDL